MLGKRKVKMDSAEKFGLAGMVAIIALVVAAVGGWVANIVKLFGLLDGDVTAMLIGRAVGVFVAPLGSIMGYL